MRSSLDCFAKSIILFEISFLFSIISVLVGSIPASISVILCFAVIPFIHKFSKKYLFCSIIALTLLYIICVIGFASPSSFAVATYSVSEIAIFPLILLICLSSTYCINSLQQDKFSLVISVIKRTLTALFLKSIYPFFICSTPIEKDGDNESPQTSAFFLTLNITWINLSIAFF